MNCSIIWKCTQMSRLSIHTRSSKTAGSISGISKPTPTGTMLPDFSSPGRSSMPLAAPPRRSRTSLSPMGARDPGDLANLFHMPESMCDDTKADVSGYRNNVTIHYDSATDDGNIAHISAVQAPDPRRIAIYRDSFGTALLAGSARKTSRIPIFTIGRYLSRSF